MGVEPLSEGGRPPSVSTTHKNSRKLIFRGGLLLSVLVVPSPSPCPSLGVMECQGSSEDEKSRSWVFDEWLLINVRVFLGRKLMFYFVISVKFQIFFTPTKDHWEQLLSIEIGKMKKYIHCITGDFWDFLKNFANFWQIIYDSTQSLTSTFFSYISIKIY